LTSDYEDSDGNIPNQNENGLDTLTPSDPVPEMGCISSYFSGQSSYTTDIGKYAVDNGGLAAHFWFYPANSTKGNIITFLPSETTGSTWYIRRDGTNVIFGKSYDSSKKETELTFEDGSWYLVAMQWDLTVDPHKWSIYLPNKGTTPSAWITWQDEGSDPHDLPDGKIVLGDSGIDGINSFNGFIYEFLVYSGLEAENNVPNIIGIDNDGFEEPAYSKDCSCSFCHPIKGCLDTTCFYPADNTVFPGLCNSTCLECSAKQSCTSCIDENASAKNGVCSCNDGFYPDPVQRAALCNACGNGCNKCTSTATCQGCKDKNSSPQPDGSCSCNSGFYATSTASNSFSCTSCESTCSDCSDGQCNACKDPNASPFETSCKCNDGFYSVEGTCQHCPAGCVTCDQSSCSSCAETFALADGSCVCEKGKFEYNDGSKVICTTCAETCNTCTSDPQCYKCGSELSQGSASCYNATVGYKLKFNDGVVVVTFANDLEHELSKKNFKISPKDGRPFKTESWVLTKVSASEYHIATDLKKSDLPVKVILDFGF